MGRKYQVWRWIVNIGGCAVLLQAGTCTTTGTGNELASQFVIPQLANVVSDFAFFILDSVLVHLTT